MQRALDGFRANIVHVRQLGSLHAVIKAQTTDIIDLSDILRAQLVMAVSALDHYVHEATTFGMLEVYQRSRPETDAFLRFRLSMRSMQQGLLDPSRVDWLETELREQFQWQSFQQADKLADAIRLISDKKIWEEVGAEMGLPAHDAKERLNLIVDRRNKIAHEADIEPPFPGVRWPIDESLVNSAIDFIVQLVETIHAVVHR